MATIHHATRKKAEKLGITLDSPDGELFAAFYDGVMVSSGETAKEALDEAVKALAEKTADAITGENEPGELNGLDDEPETDDVEAQSGGPSPDHAEASEDAEADDEKPSGSVVKGHYKTEYKARGDATCCGDDLSQVLKSAVTSTDAKGKPFVDMTAMRELAEANGEAERFGKWAAKLNPGMVRMNLGNVFRRVLREGGEIYIGKATYTAEDLGIEEE